MNTSLTTSKSIKNLNDQQYFSYRKNFIIGIIKYLEIKIK